MRINRIGTYWLLDVLDSLRTEVRELQRQDFPYLIIGHTGYAEPPSLREGIAAYRDTSGKLYARSAACTHVGCHLHWNSFETCWDCPCHGSHFAIDGTPLNAPAIGPLAEADIKTRSGDYAGEDQDGGRQTALHSGT